MEMAHPSTLVHPFPLRPVDRLHRWRYSLCPVLHSQRGRSIWVWLRIWVGGSALWWCLVLLNQWAPWWFEVRCKRSGFAPCTSWMPPHWGSAASWPWGPGPLWDIKPLWLRRKELHACELGVGVWCFSETQLSEITQKSCSQQIKSLARQAHRDVRVYTGAPVQTRVNSAWAGTWSGVAVVSDFPGRTLALPYAGSEYDSGRVLVTQHFINDVPVTLVTVYWFPRGPTRPDSHHLNNELLMAISTEVVIGGNGIRIIAGDFNETEQQGAHFPLWARYGWQNAQTFASDHWGWTPQNTSKGAKEVDMLWLSPEALALLRTVEVHGVFMEHSTVVAGLDLSQPEHVFLSWPMPSAIPWDKVKDTWQPEPLQESDMEDTTMWFGQWGRHFETSLDGYVSGQPQMKLAPQQRGRGARTQPEQRRQAPPMARPSREGEIKLRSDFAGSTVRAWFKQLRRFQSLLHSVRADSPTINAALYQAEVWSAIRRARGFQPSFSMWWSVARQFDHPDAPSWLPSSLPTLRQLEGMFISFKSCFDAFESWHIRQRTKLLKAKHEHTLATLHSELRDQHKEQVDSFTIQREYSVLAVDQPSKSLELDRPLDPRGFSTWTLADAPCAVTKIDQNTCEVNSPEPAEPMDPLNQQLFLSKTQDIHDELTALWQPRWNATPKLSDSDWKRFMDFTKAKMDFQVEDITLSMWKKGLKRFKPRAAVGVDGFSHIDLQRMPDSMTLQLLELLRKIELGEVTWPKQLLYGKVACLAKKPQATLPDQYRPVVIFAVIYRAWASLRSQLLLRQIAPLLDRFLAFGFLPQKETAMYWMGLQSDLEQLAQSDGTLNGVCTDLQKAFNHIPRPQTAILAAHLGVPQRILHPWMTFLGSCTRAFMVRNSLSPAITSTVGMPEGDALSVYAMVQLDLAWHTYLMVFQPTVKSWSFVDNLTWTSPSTGDTAAALVGTKAFFQLWNLELDDAKTYAWSTDRAAQKDLRGLGLQTVQMASELGGLMSFSCRRRVGAQLQRAESLEPRWKKLKMSLASLPQKLTALVTSFWPKAMHGASNAPFTVAQIGNLRSKAVKALGLNKAGSNPLLRLTLSGQPLADPGFFQLTSIVTTFVRIAGKHPDLRLRQQHFVEHFDGKLTHGPCCALVTQFSMLGWRLEPPWFADHDGVWFHLYRIDPRFLRTLLWEGWLQFLAGMVNHRHTMSTLTSLDPDLVLWNTHRLNALDRSRLSALQSGSFMSSDFQSKLMPPNGRSVNYVVFPMDKIIGWYVLAMRPSEMMLTFVLDDLCLALHGALTCCRCGIRTPVPWNVTSTPLVFVLISCLSPQMVVNICSRMGPTLAMVDSTMALRRGVCLITLLVLLWLRNISLVCLRVLIVLNFLRCLEQWDGLCAPLHRFTCGQILNTWWMAFIFCWRTGLFQCSGTIRIFGVRSYTFYKVWNTRLVAPGFLHTWMLLCVMTVFQIGFSKAMTKLTNWR